MNKSVSGGVKEGNGTTDKTNGRGTSVVQELSVQSKAAKSDDYEEDELEDAIEEEMINEMEEMTSDQSAKESRSKVAQAWTDDWGDVAYEQDIYEESNPELSEVIGKYHQVYDEEEEFEEEIHKKQILCDWTSSESTISKERSKLKVSVTVETIERKSEDNEQERPIKKYNLSDGTMQVQIIELGATIVSIKVPDLQGNLSDVVLGFDTPEEYMECGCLYFGTTVGRTVGVITNGEFKMSGKGYYLVQNYGCRHHKNGGYCGFGRQIWQSYVVGTKVVMTLVSKDGEEGYPGSIMVQRIFSLLEGGRLTIETFGMSANPSPLSVSTSLYVNLGGHAAGSIATDSHLIQVNSDRFLKFEYQVPTGGLINVINTPHDLRKLKPVHHTNLDEITYALRPSGQCQQLAVRLIHPRSGRYVEISTNHPSIQIDKCQHLPGPISTITQEIRPFYFASYQDLAYDKDVPSFLSDQHIANRSKTSAPENEEDASRQKFPYWLTPQFHKYDGEGVDYMECPVIQHDKEVEEDSGEGENEYSDQLAVTGKENASYKRGCAIGLTPIDLPDAVNHKNFPSVVLRPGKEYRRIDTYKFGLIRLRQRQSEYAIERECPKPIETPIAMEEFSQCYANSDIRSETTDTMTACNEQESPGQEGFPHPSSYLELLDNPLCDSRKEEETPSVKLIKSLLASSLQNISTGPGGISNHSAIGETEKTLTKSMNGEILITPL